MSFISLGVGVILTTMVVRRWLHAFFVTAFAFFTVALAGLVPFVARAETPEQIFVRVMSPLAGRWACTGFDDVTGRAIRLTEVNAFELNHNWFRSHEVDDRGIANDVFTSFRSGGGKWRSILANDDGTFGVFTYDNAPVPSSWATASLSATAKPARFWLKHGFASSNEFHYDIRVMDHGRLMRLEHGICKRG